MNFNRINEKEVSQFFEYLGEIWRDITALEFLMRCAIAKKEGETFKFPKPPYDRGKSYNDYPDSFSHYNFEMVVEKFNKKFPEIKITQELTELRNAMAHGIIALINNTGADQLIKFKENKKLKKLSVEYSLSLDLNKLAQIRQSLHETKTSVMKEAADD